MFKGGIIIRLIDVVLILLLGFLKVSDIVHKKQIKLPSSTRSQSKLEVSKEVLALEVKVLSLTNKDNIPTNVASELAKINSEKEPSLIKQSQLYCSYFIQENLKGHHIYLLDKLDKYLDSTYTAYKTRGDSMFVVINPDSNSIVQGTINLIDICRRHNIKRSFMYTTCFLRNSNTTVVGNVNCKRFDTV